MPCLAGCHSSAPGWDDIGGSHRQRQGLTGRFSRPPGLVVFERLCRERGIIQRFTKVRSPTTTGKIERFHRPPAPQPAPGAAPRPTGGGAPDASVVGPAAQVCRRVQTNGTIRLGARWLSVGRRLAGTEVEVRVSASLLQVAQDGLLLKTMPIPPGVDPARLLDARPADPGPPGRLGPVQVTRQVHKVGTVTVAGQKFRRAPPGPGSCSLSGSTPSCSTSSTTRNDVVRFGPTRPPRPRRRAGGGKHQPEPSGPASTEN